MYKTNQHTADRANQRRKEDGQTARQNHPDNERQLCIFSRCGNAEYELPLQVATVQLVLSAQRQKERGCKGGLWVGSVKLGHGVVSNGWLFQECVSGGENTRKVLRLKEDQSRSWCDVAWEVDWCCRLMQFHDQACSFMGNEERSLFYMGDMEIWVVEHETCTPQWRKHHFPKIMDRWSVRQYVYVACLRTLACFSRLPSMFVVSRHV